MLLRIKYARIADTLDIKTAANAYYRDGYKFLGWSTSPKTYEAGETINYYEYKETEGDTTNVDNNDDNK